MTSIPKSLDDLSPAWIAEQLGVASPPISMDLTPMGEGVGMMSTMSRIRLDWAENGTLPQNLVIKIAAENDTNRNVAQQFNLYLKEVSYYRDLSALTSARSPRIYALDIDSDQNFFILMEDVTNYRMGNQVTGATLDETMICVTELAKLHAAFWNRIDGVDWLPHISGSDNARNMALGAEVGWKQTLEYFGEFVPGSIRDAHVKYLQRIPMIQEQLDQEPRTLIHGDFRMDNMLFGVRKDDAPLLIVDFQGPLKGNGIQDLAYLLSHSVQTEVRRQCESQILDHYVDTLRLEGIREYSTDKAWADYRLAVLYCWTVAVVIAGTMDPANERGYAWMSKMVERNGLAIEDLDCLELLDS